MNKPYYTLIVKYEAGDSWGVAFGDYDRECVKDEREDSYEECYATKIIKTSDDQASITRAVELLNA